MSFSFDPTTYGTEIADLIQAADLCELGPGAPNRNVADRLRQLDQQAVCGAAIVDADMAACFISGLWLLHNFLDESHTISQDIHTSTGSYWHGIMHRREPDYPNSKYWFRRAGEHPIFPALCVAAGEFAAAAECDQTTSFLAKQADWDPYRFVDACEAARPGSGDEQLCRNIAQLEWQILFDYCYEQTTKY